MAHEVGSYRPTVKVERRERFDDISRNPHSVCGGEEDFVLKKRGATFRRK
jgi:hypothetical protein